MRTLVLLESHDALRDDSILPSKATPEYKIVVRSPEIGQSNIRALSQAPYGGMNRNQNFSVASVLLLGPP